MERQAPFFTDNDFAELDFKDRFRLAFELTKSHGLVIFALLFVFALLIAGYVFFVFKVIDIQALARLARGVDFGMSIGPIIFGLFLFFILVFLIMPFLGLGLRHLALYYVMGEEPESVMAAVLAPARRWGFFLICFLLWFAVYIGFIILSSVIEFVPLLGQVISLLLATFFYLVRDCAISYMADKGLYKKDMTQPLMAVSDPFSLVYGRLQTWGVALLTIFIMYFVPGILIGFGYGINKVSFIFGLALMAVGALLMIVVTIFHVFFMLITYKHTSFTDDKLQDIFQ